DTSAPPAAASARRRGARPFAARVPEQAAASCDASRQCAGEGRRAVLPAKAARPAALPPQPAEAPESPELAALEAASRDAPPLQAQAPAAAPPRRRLRTPPAAPASSSAAPRSQTSSASPSESSPGA